MFDFIVNNNLSTIIVGVMIAVIVTAVVIKMYRDKKNGKSSCGCNCANCSRTGTCHTK